MDFPLKLMDTPCDDTLLHWLKGHLESAQFLPYTSVILESSLLTMLVLTGLTQAYTSDSDTK